MPSRPICFSAFLFKKAECVWSSCTLCRPPSSIPYHCYINTPSLIALSQTQPNALCVQRSITNRWGHVGPSSKQLGWHTNHKEQDRHTVLTSRSSDTHKVCQTTNTSGVTENTSELHHFHIQSGARNAIPLIVYITHFYCYKNILTSGTELIVIGWKIVPNESL